MRKQFLHLALIATAGLAVGANAATPKAETGLLGVKLYDSGLLVLKKFGSPDEVQAVTLGGGTTFGGGGGIGAPRGGGGFPGAAGGGAGRPGGNPGGGGGGAAAGAENSINPFDFGDNVLRQAGPQGLPGRGGAPSAGGGGPQGPPGGFPGRGGFPGAPGGGAPGAGGAPAGGGAPTAGAGDRVTVTRWVYNRRASKYAFIVDKQGRIVQIEAIGLRDANVKTATKLSFGANFATLIKTYGNPDGYEISGDNILIKYLTRKKIAFKLSRLGAKQLQVVTGIVVAAGKS